MCDIYIIAIKRKKKIINDYYIVLYIQKGRFILFYNASHLQNLNVQNTCSFLQYWWQSHVTSGEFCDQLRYPGKLWPIAFSQELLKH